MEGKRSSASRAPTHNEYNELPASSKPHMYLKITEQMGTIVDNTAVSKSKLQTLQVTYPTRTFCSLNHSVKNNIY